MTKRITSLFVLTLLLVAMFAMVSEASREKDEWAAKLRAYSLQVADPSAPEPIPASSRGAAISSLGTDGPDGGSPGYVVFRSYHDHPQWYDGGHLIDWRAEAKLHMVFINQAVGGLDRLTFGRWPHYNMFDATVTPNGVFVSGANGVPIMTDPFAKTAEYPQIDVDNLGRAMPAAHAFVPTAPESPSNARTSNIWWDIGSFTFDPDTLPHALAEDTGPDASIGYPKIEYQEWGGVFVTHILSNEWSPRRTIGYWRRVGGPGTYQGWTKPLILDTLNSTNNGNNSKLLAQHSGPNVAIVWVGETLVSGVVGDPVYASSPEFILSTDMGASWGSPSGNAIINYVAGENNWSSWVDVEAMYDADGFVHIVYNTMEWDGATLSFVNSVNPTRIFHWTNRQAGPNAGGKLSIVQHVELEWGLQCGRGWTNETNTARAVISECNERMYVVWMQFADTDTDDTSDCTDTELRGFTGSSNAELYLSVSLGLNGELWDRRRNITNSHTPGCDGTLNNECDHDTYPSLSRLGMDMSTMGTTYWGAVVEAFGIQAEIAPAWPVPSSYTDSTYIDMMWIDDAFPGIATNPGFLPPGGDNVWSLNPIKWARIPCLPPIIKPSINILGDPFLYPADWVDSAEAVVIPITVENLGNEVLLLQNVVVDLVQGPSGAVTASPTSATIQPASTDVVNVTINPGGFIGPSPGTAVIVEANVEFHSDDPDRPIVYYRINTVVTDSVVQVAWDSVATDAGYGLILSNIGNSGNTGFGELNLDFVRSGQECSANFDSLYTEDVYLYSSTPLVMQSVGNFSWNPFHSNGDPKSYNFQPVPGAAESKSGKSSVYSQYTTGTFVSSDSAIGCTKTWATPLAGATAAGEGFVIEKWELYSFDGQAHTDVALGTWIDWDIPSDTGSNNMGGVEEADDYAWMRGLEYGEDDGCNPSNTRYGASGLLGYYMSNAYTVDTSVNNVGIFGAYVHLDEDEFADGTDSLIVDSIWAWLNRGTFVANNDQSADQQILLSYGLNDIPVGDTLVIWSFHATVYGADQTALANLVTETKAWYRDNRHGIGTFGCCGAYTGGLVGNVDFDLDGKLNLTDITRLIDRVYVSKVELDCEGNGDIAEPLDGKINLADITRLIDRVYVSKTPTTTCP